MDAGKDNHVLTILNHVVVDCNVTEMFVLFQDVKAMTCSVVSAIKLTILLILLDLLIMSELRKLFPLISPHVVEHKIRVFEEKMKYLDVLQGDLIKYKEQFPNIPEPILRSYYLEFLDKLDIYQENEIPPLENLDKIPENVLYRIFRHIDFLDLVRYSMTNYTLYKRVFEFEFFQKRLHWEREHIKYINFCLREKKFDQLVYRCLDHQEEEYKNQIVLRRYLSRINPDDEHKYSNFNPYSVFKHFFVELYECYFTNVDSMLRTLKHCFNRMTESELKKYYHGAAVARRYGFIHCFKSVSWADDIQPIRWCREASVIQGFKDIMGSNPKKIKCKTPGDYRRKKANAIAKENRKKNIYKTKPIWTAEDKSMSDSTTTENTTENTTEQSEDDCKPDFNEDFSDFEKKDVKPLNLKFKKK